MKLIDKDALVAEIENYKKSIEEDGEHCSLVVGKHKGQKMASEYFLSLLDTLEVKEVDFEKEYERYYEQERNIQTFKLAKHFFELGLKSQKGE